LADDVSEPVEGNLELEVKTEAADEVEELEAQIGEDLDGREDVLNGEIAHIVCNQKDEEAREIGH
jgi:hypothetical protein